MKTPVGMYAHLARVPLETAKQMLMPLPCLGWEYPDWYFKFLRGELPLATVPDQKVINLLKILSDYSNNRWHIICKETGINRGTVRACEELGLVEEDLKIEHSDCCLGLFRILETGKMVLEKNSFII